MKSTRPAAHRLPRFVLLSAFFGSSDKCVGEMQ